MKVLAQKIRRASTSDIGMRASFPGMGNERIRLSFVDIYEIAAPTGCAWTKIFQKVYDR
jgi:hypothetical protein